ncbi:tlde1 domain-containing protein, partial [Rhodoferax mekongensis]|uniref:tlde1 domain-containing protein n=1 Tax=Rhodoferax mekongensis TaxID=3068341 RepID=UPI0028BE2FE2
TGFFSWSVGGYPSDSGDKSSSTSYSYTNADGSSLNYGGTGLFNSYGSSGNTSPVGTNEKVTVVGQAIAVASSSGVPWNGVFTNRGFSTNISDGIVTSKVMIGSLTLDNGSQSIFFYGDVDQKQRDSGYEVKSYIRYDQTLGRFIAVDGITGNETVLAVGYSGNNKKGGLNNPSKQNIENEGPLPEGNYKIENLKNNPVRVGTPRAAVMYDSMRLTAETGMTRNGFLIHDNFNSLNASNGCIATDLQSRIRISDAAIRSLQVVK